MAQTEKPVLIDSITAAADLTRHRFVSYAGAVATAGAVVLGVANTDANDTEQVPVMVIGIAIVTAGAAIALAAPLEVGTAGKAITRTTNKLVGYAMDAASQDGDLIRVRLTAAES